MFQSSTILRELVHSLAKVTLLLKHSVKLRHCKLCGDVAACLEMACVMFVVQTEFIMRVCGSSVTLARLCTSSLRMVEDRNM